VSLRTGLVLVGVLVLVLAGGIWLLVGGQGDGADGTVAVKDPLAEALSYAPASAPVVAQFDVQRGSAQGAALRRLSRTFPAARFAADGVRSSARGLGLDADADFPQLLGGPVVAWGPADAITSLGASIASFSLDLPAVAEAGVTAAVVGPSTDDVAAVFERATDDGRLRKLADVAPRIAQYAIPDAAARYGVRDATVVLGGSAAALKTAFALHDAKGGLTKATFTNRLGPLARVPALIRAAGPARPLVAPRAQGVPWVDALRDGAVAIAIQKPGVRLRVHLATDQTAIKDTDLPLAPGAQPPQPAPGPRPIDAAVRDLAQTIHVLDATKGDLDLPLLAPVFAALTTLDSVKGPLKTFGRIDVDDALIDQLTGTTTITPEATKDTISVRAELKDGDPLRTALNRIAAVPDFALKLAGVDLNVDRDGDAYTITKDGKAFMKAAVLGSTLVVTNELTASLTAIAARRPQSVAGQSAGGALSLHLDGQELQDQLVERLKLPELSRLVLGGFGDIDASARAERTGLDVDATLRLSE
jgi:hypothetical protein